MDDEEEKMCLLSENNDDCIAGGADSHKVDEEEHGDPNLMGGVPTDTYTIQASETVIEGEHPTSALNTEAVSVVNDLIANIETHSDLAGLPTSRSLPSHIHDCTRNDAENVDPNGCSCPNPTMRTNRTETGGEALIVDVHLPPQGCQAPPVVPLRPCKHAINRSQKCISDVTNAKSRTKEVCSTVEGDSLSCFSQSETGGAEAFDKIETVNETCSTYQTTDAPANAHAHNQLGTNSLETFKNRFRFCSESAASFVLHNLPASIKAGLDIKERVDLSKDKDAEDGVMEQLMQYSASEPDRHNDEEEEEEEDHHRHSHKLPKSKYMPVSNGIDDLCQDGLDYEEGSGLNGGDMFAQHHPQSSLSYYADYPNYDPHASLGSIKSPEHQYNSVPRKFEGGCGLSQSSSMMSMPVCRICQLPSLEPSNPLISPCRCLGSIRYVHNNCLLKWLEVSSRRRNGPPCCELCQYPYLRHKKFVISNWRYPECSLRDKILHTFFLVCIIVMIGCAAVTITCFKEARWPYHPPPNKYQPGELSPPEMISLLCAILFFSAFFLAMYVELKAKHTVYQLLCKFFYMNHEWSVEEYDRRKDLNSSKRKESASSQA